MIFKLAKRYCNEVCMVELLEKKDTRSAIRLGGGITIPEDALLVLPGVAYKEDGEKYLTVALGDVKCITVASGKVPEEIDERLRKFFVK